MKNKYNLRLGIVIIGFNNKKGIQRLLSSIDRVNFGNDQIKLIFSIDFSGNNDVQLLAEKYEWNHGEKIIKTFSENLGLKSHILKCGDYIEEYDLDAIIVLEDDIYVSPNVYQFALQSVEYYKDNNQIAGISLYKHEFNLNAKHPFVDYNDGYDVFFMQYAQSWGQVWMRESWRRFISWLRAEEWKKMSPKEIPRNVMNWKNSWLKYHIMYCISENKFFVYPRVSLSTNFSDIGVHGDREYTDMQVKLDYSCNPIWRFVNLSDSLAVYDAFFQNVILRRYIEDDSYIDLYGIKKIDHEYNYLLSMNNYSFKVIKSWGLLLRPIEANVFNNIPGNQIKVYDLRKNKCIKEKSSKRYVFEYELKGINLLSLECICFMFNKIIYVLNRKSKILKSKYLKPKKKQYHR